MRSLLFPFVFLSLVADTLQGTIRVSGQERIEMRDLKKFKHIPVEPNLFPVERARAVAKSIRPIQDLLHSARNASYNGRRARNRCEWTRMMWRLKHRKASLDGNMTLPFRNVRGDGLVNLTIESMGMIKTFDKIVPRAYVDEDAWDAPRWIFADLGARYYMRRSKSRCFGSTFEFQCGYPGAEKFEWHAFDINATHAKGYPPWVSWTTAAVWDENTTIVVEGKEAGASAHEEGSSSSSSSSFSSSSGSGSGSGDEEPRLRVPAIDFSSWLINHVKPEDFVVVKMDIENAEFRVFTKLFSTGAIELIDEVFLECHGPVDAVSWELSGHPPHSLPLAWVRSTACLKLERQLRRAGIFLHEWD